MKKLIIGIFVLISIKGLAQSVPPGYTGISARYQWLAGEFKSFTMPGFAATPALRTGQTTHAGAIGLDTVAHIPYYYSGGVWREFGNNQTISVSGTTTGITTLSNGGGSMTIAGGGINTIGVSGSTITITGTEVDGSITNEIQTLSGSGTSTPTITLSGGGGNFSITGAGIAVASRSGTAITITATEEDGSTTNEIQVLTAGGSTSPTINLSNGGSTITLRSTGITSLSRVADTITIASTEVDGSPSNELQTLANTSTSTNHTATLSNSGGSIRYEEGSGISLTTTGTTLDGVLTIAANDNSATNEAQTLAVSGTTSANIILSQIGGIGGGTATIVSGTGITIAQSSGTITITNSGVVDVTASDGNGFDFTMSGTTTKNIALTTTLTSGSVFFAGAGGAINEDNNDLYFDNTNDYLGVGMGAPTVTLDVYRNDAEVYVAQFINDGGNGVYIKGVGSLLLEVANASASRFSVDTDGSIAFNSQTGSSGQILKSNGATSPPTWVNASTVFTEVDGSVTNEVEDLVMTDNSGGPILQLKSSSNAVLGEWGMVAGTGISLSGTGSSSDMETTVSISSSWSGQTAITTLGTITTGEWNATDIAYENIAQLSAFSLLGNSSGSTADIGGVSLGAGLSFSSGSLVAADDSPTNEIQTFSSSSGATSLTWTLSDGGSLTLVAGCGISFSIGGTSSDPTITIGLTICPEP